MKRILGILISLLFVFPATAQYRYASRIAPLPALPAVCDPNNGDIVYLTAGAGVSPGAYGCIAANTWRPLGAIGNQFVFNQGTITASTPFIQHTATWNNAGVSFVNFSSNITDTASAATSRLFQLQVGGADRFFVLKDGSLNSTSNVFAGAGNQFAFGSGGAARSRIASSADGLITLLNAASSGFGRLNLGPVNAANPAIATSTVGGQAQGIIILKADNNNQTFANLGAAANGSMIYCADCTIANPCAGAGTGAIAKRLNGVWVCN